MRRYEVQSGNVARLPQGKFVELASVIDVIDITEQDVVWNVHDDTDGDYEFATEDNASTNDNSLNKMEKAANANSRLENFKPQKEIGFMNAGFIILLTLIIYPILMIGNNLWNIANEVPLFKEMFKFVSTILRA
jgi:hypothetical protein